MKKLEMNEMESLTGNGSCEVGFEICSDAEWQAENDYVAAHPMRSITPDADLCALFSSLTFFGMSFSSFDQFSGYC